MKLAPLPGFFSHNPNTSIGILEYKFNKMKYFHSFIHIEHLYSASSRKLLRSAPNASTVKQSSLKVRKNAGEVVLLKMRSSEGRPFL